MNGSVQFWRDNGNGFNFMFEPIENSIRVIKTEKGYTVVYLTNDWDSQNPRENQDNIGTMVCLHNRYNLGDKIPYRKKDFDSWDALKKNIETENDIVIMLPLFLLDHSGLRMKTSSFGDPWDSGQVGFIYITKKKFIEEYGELTEGSVYRAKKMLENEVEQYNSYLSGDSYAMVMEMYDNNKQQIDYDICGGFLHHELAIRKLEKRLIIHS